MTPIAFAVAIAAAYRRRGLDPVTALRSAQITPQQLQASRSFISARQMELLSATAMRELDDEALSAFSRRLPWGSYGMLARASLTAPNLGVALQRWCRHHGLLTDDVRLQLVSDGNGTTTASVEERVALPASTRELILVFLLRNIHGLACWYVDSRIPLRHARFPYAAPDHADAYRHMFAVPPAFDSNEARAEIGFDARYLALPIRRDEKALQQMLQQHALNITVLQYRRDRLLVQQVRQVLGALLDQDHGAARIATALHTSVRTLHRQLKEEGASLQQLKDEVRSERARELLQRSDKPVKQVAMAAGFRNEKSFMRAFRLWTGVSPSEFREEGKV